jgi:hypothetical protein
VPATKISLLQGAMAVIIAIAMHAVFLNSKIHADVWVPYYLIVLFCFVLYFRLLGLGFFKKWRRGWRFLVLLFVGLFPLFAIVDVFVLLVFWATIQIIPDWGYRFSNILIDGNYFYCVMAVVGVQVLSYFWIKIE